MFYVTFSLPFSRPQQGIPPQQQQPQMRPMMAGVQPMAGMMPMAGQPQPILNQHQMPSQPAANSNIQLDPFGA